MGEEPGMTQDRERTKFVVALIGTFALVLGILSGVVTLLGIHFTTKATCAYIFLSCLAALIIHRNLTERADCPRNPSREAGGHSGQKICCPCTLALSKEVAALAKECFGSDTIALDRYEQLRVKNPYILACLLSSSGRFSGYFDIVPLDDQFGSLFLSGQLGEKDITHEHVLAPAFMNTSKFVYLSGIAAVNASTMAGMQNASILLWASLKYLERFYGGSTATAFASAVTIKGEHLLQRLGLMVHSMASARHDGHSLYWVDLSHDRIQSLLKSLPDYGGLVELPWNSPRAVPVIQPRGRRGSPIRSPIESPVSEVDGGLRRVKRASA